MSKINRWGEPLPEPRQGPNLGDLLVQSGVNHGLAHAIERAICGHGEIPNPAHLQMLGMGGVEAEEFVKGLAITRAAEAAIRKGAKK